VGPGLGYWSIFAKESPDQLVGWILLIPMIRSARYRHRLAVATRRLGATLCRRAARPIVEHAFLTVDLPRIVADIDPANVASVRVAEKIGMRFAGDGTYANGEACKRTG